VRLSASTSSRGVLAVAVMRIAGPAASSVRKTSGASGKKKDRNASTAYGTSISTP
jgi:hypothetical protein